MTYFQPAAYGTFYIGKDKIYYRNSETPNLMEHSIGSGETVTIYDGETTNFNMKYVQQDSRECYQMGYE